MCGIQGNANNKLSGDDAYKYSLGDHGDVHSTTLVVVVVAAAAATTLC